MRKISTKNILKKIFKTKPEKKVKKKVAVKKVSKAKKTVKEKIKKTKKVVHNRLIYDLDKANSAREVSRIMWQVYMSGSGYGTIGSTWKKHYNSV